MSDDALFVRAAQLRYEAVKYPAQRFWRELNAREQGEWIDVMRTSAAALILARKELAAALRTTTEPEAQP